MILPLAGGGSTFLGVGTGTTSGAAFLGGPGTLKTNALFFRKRVFLTEQTLLQDLDLK